MRKLICLVLAVVTVICAVPVSAAPQTSLDTGIQFMAESGDQTQTTPDEPVEDKPDKPKNVNVAVRGVGSVKVTWDKADGAKTYYVYRSKKKASGYRKVAETKRKAVNISGLKTGTKYYFKVRGVSADGKKGDFSRAVGKKSVPGKAKIRSTSRLSQTSIRIKWKTQQNVDGYRIYKSTSEDGDYTVCSWTKTNTNNVVVNRLTMGRTYYFKVRAFKDEKGKRYYGEYSDSFEVEMDRIDKTFADYAPTINMPFEELVGDNGSNKAPHPPAAGTYKIIIDDAYNVVMVYKRDTSGSYSIPVRYMICTTGKPSTPTRKGTFSLSNKKRFSHFSASVGGMAAQYWSRIVSETYFHTILYRTTNADTYSSSYLNLGQDVSHGCVRLTVPDARWIYYNCAAGTTVVSRVGSRSDSHVAAIRKKLKLTAYPKEHVTMVKGSFPNTDNWEP